MSSSYIVPDRVEKNDRVTQETEYKYINNNNNNNLNLNQLPYATLDRLYLQ